MNMKGDNQYGREWEQWKINAAIAKRWTRKIWSYDEIDAIRIVEATTRTNMNLLLQWRWCHKFTEELTILRTDWKTKEDWCGLELLEMRWRNTGANMMRLWSDSDDTTADSWREWMLSRVNGAKDRIYGKGTGTSTTRNHTLEPTERLSKYLWGKAWIDRPRSRQIQNMRTRNGQVRHMRTWIAVRMITTESWMDMNDERRIDVMQFVMNRTD